MENVSNIKSRGLCPRLFMYFAHPLHKTTYCVMITLFKAKGALCSTKKGIRMEFFNPDKHLDRVIESFQSGPSVIQLIGAGTAEGYTKIFCLNFEGKKRSFYIPQHQPGLRRCKLGKSFLILTKVTKTAKGQAKFWLVTCVYSHAAWLFPLDVFNDEGEYQPLVETKTTTAA